MDLNDLNKVWEIKPLKKIGEENAQEILEKVAKQVQPIMRKHKWKVKMLSEFCPANPSLMGLNIGGGAEIKLRLRRPNNEWDFFPYEQILDTMLHELCHNEYGPHNSEFYRLLDELRKVILMSRVWIHHGVASLHAIALPPDICTQECEELMARGITGTGKGFDLPGRRLGGFSHNPPVSSLHRAALAAAENRARNGALLPSGPRRIGGNDEIRHVLSPIQAAAMAAERRLHDDLWCGSESAEGTSSSPLGPSKTSGVPATPASTRTGTSSLDADRLRQPRADDHGTWQCDTCTLLNQALSLLCEACGAAKPRGGPGTGRSKLWSCKFCTLDNSAQQDRCLACGEWRYSYGPLV